jgi:hypothetical protein
MKAFATPITVANLTRMACTRWTPVLDEVAGTLKYGRVRLQARPNNAAAGTTESDQESNGYEPVSLKITNSACDNYLPNPAPTHNQYSSRLLKGSGTYAGLLDAIVAARNAAGTEAQKNDATLTALATAGAIPPLS